MATSISINIPTISSSAEIGTIIGTISGVTPPQLGSSLSAVQSIVSAGATGVVTSLKTTLTGTLTYSLLGGAGVILSSSGAVSLTAALSAGASVSFIARVQNNTGEAIEERITLSVASTVPDAPTLFVSAGNNQTILDIVEGHTGGQPITSHHIYRGLTANSETLLTTITSGQNYVDLTAVNGTTYFYRVTSINSVGESAQSNEASATPTPISTGDVISIEIRDDTLIDPESDTTTHHGAIMNGTSAKLVFKSLQIDPNKDALVPNKVILTVTDPGFEGTTPITITRTVHVTAILRRQYPNNTERLASINTDGDLEIIAALDDAIYADSTIVSIQVLDGLYPLSNAGIMATNRIVKSTTRAYPNCGVTWLTRQNDNAIGLSTYHVEIFAAHRAGVPAAVSFHASDGVNNALVQTSTLPELSTYHIRGNPCEAFQADIPLAGLQRGQCTVDAWVYPRFGNNIWKLSDHAYSWPTLNPMTLLRFYNDPHTDYGGALAYVKAGSTGTGVVSLDAPTARATPFATISEAQNAIQAFNNARSLSHNDCGGSITRLMDSAGSVATHFYSSIQFEAATADAGSVIEADPSATGQIIIEPDTTDNDGDNPQIRNNILFRGVTLQRTVNTGTYGNFLIVSDLGQSSHSQICFDNCNLVSTTRSANLNFYYKEFRNCTANSPVVIGASAPDVAKLIFNFFQDSTFDPTSHGQSELVYAFNQVGNIMRLLSPAEPNPYSGEAADGLINVNNSYFGVRAAAGNFGAHNSYWNRGGFYIQNLLERAVTNGAGDRAGFFSAEGSDGISADWLLAQNLFIGDNVNMVYMEVDADIGKLVRMTSHANIYQGRSWKADPFTVYTTSTGRVGPNWEHLYSVGIKYDLVLKGTAPSNGIISDRTDPDGVQYLGDYGNPTNIYCAANQIGNNGSGPPYDPALYPYGYDVTNNASGWDGSGPGDGDYHPVGSNNLCYLGVIAEALHTRFDLSGRLRLTDGRGASGPYERTDIN